MSAAIEAGVDPSATEPTADPADAGVQAEKVSAGPDEFTAKVMQGGDFAVEQVKAAQRELSRMKSKLGQVEQVVDAIGGSDALISNLRRLNALVSNPKGRELIEHFEKTGEFPASLKTNGAAEPTDEFEEPWDKNIKPVETKVSALETELRQLRGERGVEKVQGFFKSFFEEYPLPDEDKQQLAVAMRNQAQQWAQTPQGINLLNSMDAQTFNSLALSKLTKAQIRSALLREEESKRQQKAALATDVPSRGTTGKERATTQSPVEAYNQACRELGVDPNRPLLR